MSEWAWGQFYSPASDPTQLMPGEAEMSLAHCVLPEVWIREQNTCHFKVIKFCYIAIDSQDKCPRRSPFILHSCSLTGLKISK